MGDSKMQRLTDLAVKHGFALACGEALQDVLGRGGQWDLVSIQTDSTGPKCEEKDSLDIVYLKQVLASLEARKKYDLQRVFTSGCSMGSAFSEYAGLCLDLNAKELGISITAFATHSTGLKVK